MCPCVHVFMQHTIMDCRSNMMALIASNCGSKDGGEMRPAEKVAAVREHVGAIKVDRHSPCSKHGLSSNVMALLTSGCG